MARIRLESIGCRLNIGEIESLARQLSRAGHLIVDGREPADLCIFNSCTVTAIASKKSRHAVRQIKRANPGATIVVTGCHAEMAPEEMAAIGIDRIVPNRDKDRLADILTDEHWLAPPEPRPAAAASVPAPGELGHTRAFLKVQDGCDQRCTFCIVTTARGAGRSLDDERIVSEVRDLEAAGFNEVVLTGVHLGSYGHDLGRRRGLEELVRRILAESSVPRLRLSSLEPWDLDPDFFDLFADPRLQPHLHLPLQSGSDAILRSMARRTTRAEFSALLAAARERIPDLAVSTDIIVGFPGETDDHFAESLEFVEAMGFSRLHVFRYSRREGTRAATMADQVAGPVISDRSRAMLDLAQRLEQDSLRPWVGRRAEVLWEESRPTGLHRRWSGYTGSYLRVETTAPLTEDLHNRIETVHLTVAEDGVLIAERSRGDR